MSYFAGFGGSVHRVSAIIKYSVGIPFMMMCTIIWTAILTALLPWRILRIKACNYYGKFAGRFMMFVSQCPLTFVGREHLDADRPALFISNHTSIVDLFMAMWLSPVGTVGVAKKQVIWYPLFGQLYFLSGHLRIDRDNSGKAIERLRALGEYVRENRLWIWMWPEGTRARDGRLKPFKKGAVHLALQTGLPIVPVVVTGAHLAWEKNTLLGIRSVPITITALPAIETTGWTADQVDEKTEMLHQIFAAHLPPEQQPRPA
jgi:lysophosphatidate acyltransferase